MIELLNHRNKDIAALIYKVFQESYVVEAQLLKAKEFPPLKRQVADFIKDDTDFYGYWKHQELVAVTEIRKFDGSTHLQSMVVVPQYFRQGIAQKLIDHVLETYHTPFHTVETGVDNIPAIKLYEKNGFKYIKEWDTNFGIRKVRFERK